MSSSDPWRRYDAGCFAFKELQNKIGKSEQEEIVSDAYKILEKYGLYRSITLNVLEILSDEDIDFKNHEKLKIRLIELSFHENEDVSFAAAYALVGCCPALGDKLHKMLLSLNSESLNIRMAIRAIDRVLIAGG